MALEKDVRKLCDDALKSGRAAFTYAMYLRVNLAYQEAPNYRGWALIGVLMDGPMTAMLSGDEATRINLTMLATMVEKHLGQDLKFQLPEKAPMLPGASVSWLVRSMRGPKPGATTEIDRAACERIVRYAKRDGRGKVTTAGWDLQLRKQGRTEGARWRLTINHADRPETRESLSRKYYELGHIRVAIALLLGEAIDADEPPRSDLPHDEVS